MNRERARELLPVIVAFANGEEIEWKGGVGVGWRKSTGIFADNTEYRIKPKPREWWITRKDIPESGSYGTTVYLTTNDQSGDDYIKVREVLCE